MTSRTSKPIVIADYDPAWPERFRAERDLILRTCDEGAFVRIEHVGSTAVPGLAAKPIIDIMPGVRSLDAFASRIPRLASIGYQYVPEFEKPLPELNDPGMPFRRYFRKDERGARAFHLHVVEVGSEFWRDHLRFRNGLRYSPADRDAYAALKRRLAADYNARVTPASNINVGYTDLKSEFVEDVKARYGAVVDAHAPIVVAPYDASWPERAARERERIALVLGDGVAALEHIGSTSVAGLAAKPTVDLCAGMRDLSRVPSFGDALVALGYRAPRENEPDWWYAPRRAGDQRFNLHLVAYGRDRWHWYTDFRDYLRAHPIVAAEYAGLKQENAAEFGRDILGYIEAKADFVVAVRERARLWRASV